MKISRIARTIETDHGPMIEICGIKKNGDRVPLGFENTPDHYVAEHEDGRMSKSEFEAKIREIRILLLSSASLKFKEEL